jgi:hypothetical protein
MSILLLFSLKNYAVSYICEQRKMSKNKHDSMNSEKTDIEQLWCIIIIHVSTLSHFYYHYCHIDTQFIQFCVSGVVTSQFVTLHFEVHFIMP